jgi:hypothetical protein
LTECTEGENRSKHCRSDIYIDECLRKPYIIPADRMNREKIHAETIKKIIEMLNEQSASIHIDISIKRK